MQPDVNQELFNQALRDGDTDQILWLFKSDAVDVNFRDFTHDLETPLMKLCHADLRPRPDEPASDTRSSTLNILSTVTAISLKVDQQDALGRTLAMHACISNNDIMLRFAIEHGCDPAVTDRMGKNLVHYLAMSGSDTLVELVLEHLDVGQALRTLDFQGYSPVDLARQKKHSALARKLSNALVGSKKEDKVKAPQGGESESEEKVIAQTSQPASTVVPRRPPLTRRDARMQVIYNPPPDDVQTSGQGESGQRHRSVTPPPITTTNLGDREQQGNLVRSVSLRRPYIVKRAKENCEHDHMTYTPRPSPTSLSTVASSSNRASQNSNDGFIAVSRNQRRGHVSSREVYSEDQPGSSRQHTCLTLHDKNMRHLSARPGSDLPSRDEKYRTGLDGMNKSDIDLIPSQSPRQRLKPIHNYKQIHSLGYEPGIPVLNPQRANTGAMFEQTVPILPQTHLLHSSKGALSSNEELSQRHSGGHVSDRRTERRSSISLPDLRDMTGCLVTSQETLTLQDLLQNRKSRITLEDLDRRDNIKSYGSSADCSGEQYNEKADGSSSDVSMDSNFEDEKPIKRL
uniref:Uncharacterized protein n=1 Tax=Biomphalaria glabrata TaxID=6526 RepID=A0A2C9KWF8_BIOGL